MNDCEECGEIIKGKIAWFKCKRYHSKCLTKIKYRKGWENREKAVKQRWVKYHKKNPPQPLKNEIKAISQSR